MSAHFVYFIRGEQTRLVKIGHTRDLQKRFDDLQISSPDKLTLVSSLQFTKRDAMAAQGGRVTGRRHKENGTGIFAPEHRGAGGRIGGRIQGRKNKENGTGIFASGFNFSAVGRIGGRIGSRIVNHTRWHVRRGIVNPKCSLCTEGKS